jgi:hypothetical protein
MGKRALFSPPPESRQTGEQPPRSAEVIGVRALFSSEPEPRIDGRGRRYSIELECSVCRERSRLSLDARELRLLAFAPWLPGVRENRLVSCPACYRLTWCWVKRVDP